MTYPRICQTFALLLVVACTTPNPNYRPPIDAAVDAVDTSCPDKVTCSGTSGVCNLDTGKCVMCTTNEHAACTATTPICGIDNTCRGCTAHSECASAVCRPDGACSSGEDVAYVNPNGAGTECTKSQPCASLQTAVAAKRPYIKITGALTGPTTIKDTRVVLLGDPGAKLSHFGPILTVEGNSNVGIYDLEFTGGSFAVYVATIVATAPQVSLFRCTLASTGISAGSWSTLNVSQSKIYDTNSLDCGIDTYGDLDVRNSTIVNNANGICATSGKINISETNISSNLDTGIKVDNGQLNVLKSTISGNTVVGIRATTSATNISQSTIFDNGHAITASGALNISNNVIVHNGPSSSAFGGVVLFHTFGSSSFQFNTVADNQTGGVNAQTGGVHCIGNITATHNLVIRNTGGDANPQTFGTCAFRNSLFDAPNPGFADPSKNDYRLTSMTPGTIVDAADCPAGVTIDKDGDPRPSGSRCDLGADEYRPTP